MLTFETDFFASHGFKEIEGTPVTAEVYEEMCRSYDIGVAEFLDLSYVKPNILGNTRMLLTLPEARGLAERDAMVRNQPEIRSGLTFGARTPDRTRPMMLPSVSSAVTRTSSQPNSLTASVPPDGPIEAAATHPVVLALVVDAHHDLAPAHVEDRDELAVFVVHRDLGLGPREARPDEDQAHPGLLGRLCAGVDEVERLAGRADAATPSIPLRPAARRRPP